MTSESNGQKDDLAKVKIKSGNHSIWNEILHAQVNIDFSIKEINRIIQHIRQTCHDPINLWKEIGELIFNEYHKIEDGDEHLPIDQFENLILTLFSELSETTDYHPDCNLDTYKVKLGHRLLEHKLNNAFNDDHEQIFIDEEIYELRDNRVLGSINLEHVKYHPKLACLFDMLMLQKDEKYLYLSETLKKQKKEQLNGINKSASEKLRILYLSRMLNKEILMIPSNEKTGNLFNKLMFDDTYSYQNAATLGRRIKEMVNLDPNDTRHIKHIKDSNPLYKKEEVQKTIDYLMEHKIPCMSMEELSKIWE